MTEPQRPKDSEVPSLSADSSEPKCESPIEVFNRMNRMPVQSGWMSPDFGPMGAAGRSSSSS